MVGCYRLHVSESNTVSMQCSSLNFYGTTSYCESCPSASYGIYCSMVYHTMSVGDIYTVSLYPVSFTPVKVKSGVLNGISVASLAAGVSIYFQYEKIKNEMSGLVNYFS